MPTASRPSRHDHRDASDLKLRDFQPVEEIGSAIDAILAFYCIAQKSLVAARFASRQFYEEPETVAYSKH
jgi:hypothetical protein